MVVLCDSSGSSVCGVAGVCVGLQKSEVVCAKANRQIWSFISREGLSQEAVAEPQQHTHIAFTLSVNTQSGCHPFEIYAPHDSILPHPTRPTLLHECEKQQTARRIASSHHSTVPHHAADKPPHICLLCNCFCGGAHMHTWLLVLPLSRTQHTPSGQHS